MVYSDYFCVQASFWMQWAELWLVYINVESKIKNIRTHAVCAQIAQIKKEKNWRKDLHVLLPTSGCDNNRKHYVSNTWAKKTEKARKTRKKEKWKKKNKKLKNLKKGRSCFTICARVQSQPEVQSSYTGSGRSNPVRRVADVAYGTWEIYHPVHETDTSHRLSFPPTFPCSRCKVLAPAVGELSETGC